MQTVCHFSDNDKHEREAKIISVRTAFVHDKTSFSTSAQLVKNIVNGKSYLFLNGHVSFYSMY